MYFGCSQIIFLLTEIVHLLYSLEGSLKEIRQTDLGRDKDRKRDRCLASQMAYLCWPSKRTSKTCQKFSSEKLRKEDLKWLRVEKNEGTTKYGIRRGAGTRDFVVDSVTRVHTYGCDRHSHNALACSPTQRAVPNAVSALRILVTC